MFVLEPARWFERYGYRAYTETEKEALFVVWTEVRRPRRHLPRLTSLQIGKRMAIRDIPDSLAELERWSDAYARETFRPDPRNKQVADGSMALFLSRVPAPVKPLGATLASCLMEPLLREAVMIPHPPPLLELVVQSAAKCVGLFQRFCLLPRSRPFELVPLDMPRGDRMHVLTWDFECVRARTCRRVKLSRPQRLVRRRSVDIALSRRLGDTRPTRSQVCCRRSGLSSAPRRRLPLGGDRARSPAQLGPRQDTARG